MNAADIVASRLMDAAALDAAGTPVAPLACVLGRGRLPEAAEAALRGALVAAPDGLLACYPPASAAEGLPWRPGSACREVIEACGAAGWAVAAVGPFHGSLGPAMGDGIFAAHGLAAILLPGVRGEAAAEDLAIEAAAVLHIPVIGGSLGSGSAGRLTALARPVSNQQDWLAALGSGDAWMADLQLLLETV